MSFYHSLPYREAGVSSFRLLKRELDTPASLNGRNLIVLGYHYSNIILKSFNIIPLSFYHSLPYREAGVSSFRLFQFTFQHHSTSFRCHPIIHCHIGRQGYQVFAYSNSHGMTSEWVWNDFWMMEWRTFSNQGQPLRFFLKVLSTNQRPRFWALDQ